MLKMFFYKANRSLKYPCFKVLSSHPSSVYARAKSEDLQAIHP